MKKKVLSAVMVLAMLTAMVLGAAAVTAAEGSLEVNEAGLDDPATDERIDGEIAPDQSYFGVDEGLDEVLRANESSLKSIQGVTSVMGMDMDGVPTIVVFVEEGTDIGPIPEEIDGYPVHVEEDAEVTIMPYANDEEGTAEDIITDDAQETTDEEEGEAAGYTIFIYIAIAALAIVVIVLLTKKK